MPDRGSCGPRLARFGMLAAEPERPSQLGPAFGEIRTLRQRPSEKLDRIRLHVTFEIRDAEPEVCVQDGTAIGTARSGTR